MHAPVNFTWRSARRLSLAALASLVLSGCITVRLVSDYDDQIDSGLTQLNEDTATFVTKMVASAGKPEGAYAQNKEFYQKEDAKIDTLIVRAEAHRAMKSCPAPAIVDKAVAASRSRVEAFQAAHPEVNKAFLQSALSGLATVKDDDCSVGLLRLVRSAMDDLEAFHSGQGDKGIPASARDPILVGGVGSTIHTAMTVEIAKKADQKGTK